MKLQTKILSMLIIASALTSCKKDNNEEATPTTDECSGTTNAVVVNGTSASIVKSNCFSPFADAYYSEHMTDTSATTPKGTVMVFKGSPAPAAGDYTINPDVTTLTTGQAFVEYYEIATSWHALSGTVKVTDNGTSKIYTYCKLSCTDGSTTKTITVRATCN